MQCLVDSTWPIMNERLQKQESQFLINMFVRIYSKSSYLAIINYSQVINRGLLPGLNNWKRRIFTKCRFSTVRCKPSLLHLRCRQMISLNRPGGWMVTIYMCYLCKTYSVPLLSTLMMMMMIFGNVNRKKMMVMMSVCERARFSSSEAF